MYASKPCKVLSSSVLPPPLREIVIRKPCSAVKPSGWFSFWGYHISSAPTVYGDNMRYGVCTGYPTGTLIFFTAQSLITE